jgi:hypothetical protein|tara:strand:- start:897 stop:1127 length:231 start_codon:yes stop_codon:yes gene_type:complete
MIKNIIKIQKSYGHAGPTSDNSSRVALFKKVQVKTSVNGKRAQLWGLNNIKGNVSGSGGDAGQRTYFTSVFPRFSF